MWTFLFACIVPPPQDQAPLEQHAAPAVELAAPVASPAPIPSFQAKPAAPPAPAVEIALGAPVPDFTLLDQNPKSPTNGQPVSAKDYLGKVAGFYFTHAT